MELTGKASMLPQPEACLGPAASTSEQGDAPALGYTELLNDRQTEAAASSVHAARVFQSEERSEDCILHSLRNTGAPIEDSYHGNHVLLCQSHCDRLAVTVTNGIGQQVVKNPFENL